MPKAQHELIWQGRQCMERCWHAQRSAAPQTLHQLHGAIGEQAGGMPGSVLDDAAARWVGRGGSHPGQPQGCAVCQPHVRVVADQPGWRVARNCGQQAQKVGRQLGRRAGRQAAGRAGGRAGTRGAGQFCRPRFAGNNLCAQAAAAGPFPTNTSATPSTTERANAASMHIGQHPAA